MEDAVRTIYLEVVKAASRGEGAKIEVTDAVYPKSYTAGETVTIEAELTNNGNAPAENLVIDLANFTDIGLIPVDAYQKTTVDGLEVGESYKASWKFNVSEDVTDGTKSWAA